MPRLCQFSALLFMGLFTGTRAYAQADISMATHWYNRANYNPAFIARTDYLYLFSNIRDQWTGVDGAPKVFNIQASEYIHQLHSAFGLSLVSDKTGVTRSLNPLITYAYRMSNKGDWSMAMGLSMGMLVRSVDGTMYETVTDNDPSVDYTLERTCSPDANIGVEFQNEHFIFGLSSTHLFSIGSSGGMAMNANHRYGYAIYKNNNLDLLFYKLGLQLVNRNNLTVLEGNITVRFKHPTGLMKGPREPVDLGLTYRTSKQITFLLGLLLTPDLRVGYAYDQCLFSGYCKNGTHEIMVEYRIFCKAASTRLRCGDDLFWYH